MSEQQNSLQSILVEALEIEDAQKRAAFLSRACGINSALRREVEDLIQAHAAAGNFLPEQPAVTGVREAMLNTAQAISPGGAASFVSLGESPGGRIGHYKLLQQIGEGGCGVVYMAEQEDPVRRRVALKVIKLGMNTKQVVARFEAERQALAMMDHPNIAKVFDAGATEAGRPYFVMELVRGNKIAEYCDENELSTRERLDLFIQVCQAVQHAHQKGIIHRDLKPSNILVTVNDARPVPKVIDFGIAKATEGRLTDHTLFTAFDQLLGTPAYMSPEQAVMTSQDIDTRSDIYSLGVLLYELLTGTTPFDTKELLAAGLDEMRRTIREKEPMQPSTRLSTMLLKELTTTARQRRSEAPKLIHLLRGDLDWIAMKCLEKERTRRYETANGLAMDVKHYLTSEPVAARPPSNLYRFQKLVRRNKLAFASGVGLASVLVLGTVISAWEVFRARRAEREQVRLGAQAQQARRRAEGLVGQLELEKAEMLFAADDSASALMYLARLLRQNPSNHVAASRLISAMTQRSFLLPLEVTLQHSGRIYRGQFSPDGTRFVTASLDGTAKVWDTISGQPLLELNLGGAGSWASFSPDGSEIVTGTHDGTVKLWDARTGQPICNPRKLSSPVHFIDFSPDGKRIAIAFGDAAEVWEVRSGRLVTGGVQHKGQISCARFSPDGRKVVTTSFDGTAQLWDGSNGSPLGFALTNAGPRLWRAEFSPDGGRILIGGGSSARVYDAASGQLLTQTKSPESEVYSAQFGPEGRRILTFSYDRTIRLWDAASGLPVGEALHLAELPEFVTLSPDGRRLVADLGDNRARIWGLPVLSSAAVTLWHGAPVNCVRFTPDGHRLVIGDGFNAQICDLNTGRLAASPLSHGRDPGGAIFIDFSPDGQWIATGSWDRTARIWNLRTGEPHTAPLQHSAAVNSVQFRRDGKQLITGSYDGNARLWDVQTGLYIKTFTHTNQITSTRFSPDGRRLVTTSLDKTARVWDVEIGSLVFAPLEHGDTVWFAEFSRDGNSLVTASADKTARVWDAHTGKPRTPPMVHKEEVGRAQFSADGQWILTTGTRSDVQIWNARTGEPLGEPLEHGGQVFSATFSPEGHRVVTVSADHAARIWDVLTGELLAEPLRHDAVVSWAEFSPDARWVATACGDGAARVWEVPLAPAPAPSWLPNLAEELAGLRFTTKRTLATVPTEELLSLKHRLLESAENDSYIRWAKWFFADPMDRTLTPSSSFSVGAQMDHSHQVF